MNRTLTLVSLAAAALPVSPAAAQMGPGLDLSWNSFDGGGGTSAGGVLTLTGTIGQPDAGALTGGVLQLLGGLLGGGAGPAPCYPNCDGNTNGSGQPILNISDFICFQTKFALHDPYADCDGNGAFNISDFICFQTKFALGCP